MSKFLVMVQYEAWTIIGNKNGYDSILDAVLARESEVVGNGGGTTMIVEVIDTLSAYQSAAYERNQRERDAKEVANRA